MLCLVYSKNVDQTENTVSRRKHAIRNEGSQRSSDQADSSMTEAATEPTQWEPKSTSPAVRWEVPAVGGGFRFLMMMMITLLMKMKNQMLFLPSEMS